MSVTVVLPNLCVSQAVTGVSAAFGAMGSAGYPLQYCYRFVSTTACYINQGATPVATNASMPVAAGEVITLDGVNGARVAVLQQAAGGTATLTPIWHA